jgi:hypothetical protein
MVKFTRLRYDYGKRKESELLERIQEDLKEEVTPSEDPFCSHDYTSENYNIELKSRTRFDCNQYPNWFVPCNKFIDKNSEKKLVVYYHWEKDDTLWRYDYNSEDVTNFIFRKSTVSDQDTYDIPKRFFSLIN